MAAQGHTDLGWILLTWRCLGNASERHAWMMRISLGAVHATKSRKTWTDAEIIAEPVPNKELNEPQVLVKRKPVILDDGNRGDVVFVYGYPAISLFTGAGGFDLGIEQAGFTPLCQVEWDETACKTLMHNRPAFFSMHR